MLRHLITTPDYAKLIETQAKVTNKLDKNGSKKMKQAKIQSKSKTMVKRMNTTRK